MAEIRVDPSFDVCSHYLQVSKGLYQKQPRNIGDTIYPIIDVWGYFRCSRADSSVDSGPIWSKSEIILDIMHVVTYKAKMDRINSNRERVETLNFIRSMAAYSVVSLSDYLQV